MQCAVKKQAPERLAETGITLLEVMIVTVIVGVLAAVAVPIYQANVKRTRASEADAVLGSVRTALRVYYAENGSYPTQAIYKRVDSINVDIGTSDLDGTYFSISDYTYQSTDGINYTIRATGSGAQAGINRQLDQDGTLSTF
ncbi:prepilin-type N-terminal cleavage/methylation domain-containing protein [bacterium]|nr:prepilin-type N-terminal cleavage/methylation domain-containing protein [bacterium]